MTIVKLLSQVMADVGGVGKSEKNSHQGFNFRGIDTVVNAVSPAFKKYGIVVVPEVKDSFHQMVEVGSKRTMQSHVRLIVAYTFYAPDMSSITATVAAESMDSGDKATAKAMSVAFRIALLQALSLPTDEPDPDSYSYELSEAQPSTVTVSEQQVERFIKACQDKNLDYEQVADRAGVYLMNATSADMVKLRKAFDEMVAQ